MTEKIRIKDIAEKAGVSVGTVDRVLHKRSNVSKKAAEKVKKVLEEIHYKPNMYASALAYNKQYLFYLIIPRHEAETYWCDIEEGVHYCEEQRSDFHIEVRIAYYNRAESKSIIAVGDECLKAQPHGVILVPSDLDSTRTFTDKLHKSNIPFVMLDSYMPDLRPLAFFGQDSFQSGFFAARMFMLLAAKEKEILLLKHGQHGGLWSKQQANREVGFRHYMADHYPDVKIDTLELDLEEEKGLDEAFEAFFTAHPRVHHCITLSSRAYRLGNFLLKTNRRDVQIMGYDYIPQNISCLREGSVSFLVCQHAYMQGYLCVDALFRAIVLKQEVKAVNYMPIELITKENVDFYSRQLHA